MSSPKKGSTRNSPRSREAICGEYRRATSSMDRLEETTVRFRLDRRLFSRVYRADWVNAVSISVPRSSRISRSQAR